MSLRIAHPVAPYLPVAELGAVLFGGTAAAEERITLEIIGAVRMAGPEAVRHADAAPARVEAVPAPSASAERSPDGLAARHH